MRTCLFALILLAGCTSRMVLMAPRSAPASSYVCADATDASTCSPATDLVPANDSQSDSAFVVLPQECRGSFGQLVLRKRRSGGRNVWVRCALMGEAPGPFVCPVLPDDAAPSLSDPPRCDPGDPDSHGLELAIPAACDESVNQVVVSRLHSGRPGSTVTCSPPDKGGMTP